MGASTTPPSAEPTPGASGAVVAVACSGGRDSVALLHAVARQAALVPGLRVLALHVHHGLSRQADAWLAHVQGLCRAWGAQGWPVDVRWRRLALQPQAGESLEEVARQARYQALGDMARAEGCDTVLLAHHRRDQAETVLLQALRGAGAAGLAAMPPEVLRDGVRWLRPWLHHPRERIEAYIAHHGLPHVDDDSNDDERFDRNRLRSQVWPALAGAFPQAEGALAQVAARQADVLDCLQAWVDVALPQVTARPDPRALPVLRVAPWQGWTPGQRRELLRAWFRQVSGHGLGARWVIRLERELAARNEAGAAQWYIALSRAGAPSMRGQLRLYRGVVSWAPGISPASEPPAAISAADSGGPRHRPHAVPEPAACRLSLTTEGSHVLPQGLGVLHLQAVSSGGLPWGALADCELRPRAGAEQFQLGPGRPPRALKKQYQALGVPAWERDGPLLWCGGRLAFVPGLGVDARLWAPEGEPQVALHWTRGGGQGGMEDGAG